MPKIGAEIFQNDVLRRQGKLGQWACQVMAAAINAVDPYACVQSHLEVKNSTLTINGENYNLEEINRVFLIGFGKASVPMAKAVVDSLDRWLEGAYVVTKDEKFLDQNGYKDKLVVFQGAHPVPDERSVAATRQILGKIPQLTGDDLVLVVISGGGSALFTDPIEGVALGDLQVLTSLLLKSGAEIQEINTIRKHLDKVKGGRLSALLAPAQVQTLILSDVIGDDLEMIASGPTVADSTTYTDAWNIVQKYVLENDLPQTVVQTLEQGRQGNLPETIKVSVMAGLAVKNRLVGTNQLAAEAARSQAEALGFETEILTTTLTGLTEHVAPELASLIKRTMENHKASEKPVCLLLGGETTVNVTGKGLGGRNQDLVLRMAPLLKGKKGVLFISLATDGEDGPTDAAGGVMTGNVLNDAKDQLGLDVGAFIENSDAYSYLQKTGALIKIGATGTNVNDLVLIFIQ